MAKKKTHKKLNKLHLSQRIAFLILIFVVSIVILMFSMLKVNLLDEVKTVPDFQTLLKVRPKPTPKPKLTIPLNYGRTVNIPILTYHYIGDNPNPEDKARDNLSVSPVKFDEQMKYLSEHGYNPITLDMLYQGLMGLSNLPAKPVVLTFDDGYIDFYLIAYPILKRYNLHAVSFIPTGLIGQGYYLTWEQIKEMDQSGLISFQAHSVNHYNLVSLNSEQLKYQLTQSKSTLESQLGKPVNFMSYPYGTADETIWQAVKEAGYLGAVGTYYGSTESEGNLIDMPRIKISGSLSIEDFSKQF